MHIASFCLLFTRSIKGTKLEVWNRTNLFVHLSFEKSFVFGIENGDVKWHMYGESQFLNKSTIHFCEGVLKIVILCARR